MVEILGLNCVNQMGKVSEATRESHLQTMFLFYSLYSYR